MKAFKNIMLAGLAPGAIMAAFALLTDMLPFNGWIKIIIVIEVIIKDDV